MAGTKATPAKVAKVTQSAPTSKPAKTAAVKTSTATDTDLVQSGETSSESLTAEEPGDANLPGGGHADPSGDVQHEFNGVE